MARHVRQQSLLIEDAGQPLSSEAPTELPLRLDDQMVYAVDANSLIFQVFHALPEMTSPRGEPVRAVFGFTRDLLDLIEKRKPDRLLCALDPPGPTFRNELYAEYKADRAEMPEELVPQMPKIREVLAALGIPCLMAPNYEADDVLATVASQCEAAGGRCHVVTGDKDCRQLISDRVAVYNIRKQQVYDAEALADDWGIRPDQVVDFQALVGDKIDNIPGVPLIGPKLARELLDAHGTLEEVLAHADEVKGTKRRENLIRFGERAFFSRKLTRLDREVPIQPDWEAAAIGPVDAERLAELFGELGFRSLLDRAVALMPATQRVVATWNSDYDVVTSVAALTRLLSQLREETRLALETQTTAAPPRQARLIGLALAWREGKACYLPLAGSRGEQVLDLEATLAALRPLLEDPSIAKIGQNLKQTMVVLKSAGVHLQGVAFDTMLASYLLDAGARNHSLGELAQRYLNHSPLELETLLGQGKKRRPLEDVPLAELGPWAAESADIALRLHPLLHENLVREELAELNETVELAVLEVLAEMEFVGIHLATERLVDLGASYGARIEALQQQIEDLAGHPLNIGSPKQLAEVLFGELGLPVVKKTKTGASTDASVLEELAEWHPLPAKILEYRKFTKLKATYVDALPLQVNPQTHRIHAGFHQVVAATGRLSSSDPNLQNIPVRTEEGREIRSAFTAGPPGWKLLSADYSQIELRVLAHFSGDATLSEAFARDDDIHTLVASQVFGVEAGEVTRQMRHRAKAVNFGVIYGQSAFGLARSLRISREEAAAFIDAYFARYPGVEAFLRETLIRCREQGFVKTALGRRRAIRGVRPRGASPEQESRALRQLNLPERTAVNTVIQGSAADLIKLAMIRVHNELKSAAMESRLLLQIHDELLFEAPAEELTTLGELVREAMIGVMRLSVPLKVDLKAGENWAECEPVE